MEMLKLNDGHEIPAIGFGAMIPVDETYTAVREALAAGYRHIDTAAGYFNESEVGRAIKDSGIPRSKLFITSKLWIQDYGDELAKAGVEKSLENLGLDYLDLYLLHQPFGDVAGAWQALEAAQRKGLIRSIGVSNMTPNIWQKFVPNFDVVPAVNQVEFNPFTQQRELRDLLKKDHVRLEAWYPLGHGNKDLLANPTFTRIGQKYGKNVGQVIIRFEYQEGVVTLPKSTHADRIKTNQEIFDFNLTPDELAAIRALDTGKGTYNPETPGVEEFLRANIDVHAKNQQEE